jgi:hypothetical protein
VKLYVPAAIVGTVNGITELVREAVPIAVEVAIVPVPARDNLVFATVEFVGAVDNLTKIAAAFPEVNVMALIPAALITVEAVLVPATVPTLPSVAAVTAVTALAVSVIEPAVPPPLESELV